MNLFWLHENLDTTAEHHVDKHVNKMQLEATQIVCTNLIIDDLLGYIPRNLTKEENAILSEYRKENKVLSMEDRPFPYLPCHQNHPSTVWCRTSLENFYWVYCYANALGSESHYRYGTTHKSLIVLNNLPDPKHIKDIGFTQFALAMPDELKDYENPIQSYRDFYHLDKATFATWKHRSPPDWWDEELADRENRISGQ